MTWPLRHVVDGWTRCTEPQGDFTAQDLVDLRTYLGAVFTTSVFFRFICGRGSTPGWFVGGAFLQGCPIARSYAESTMRQRSAAYRLYLAGAVELRRRSLAHTQAWIEARALPGFLEHPVVLEAMWAQDAGGAA